MQRYYYFYYACAAAEFIKQPPPRKTANKITARATNEAFEFTTRTKYHCATELYYTLAAMPPI